jgi:hypothetical protein
MIENELKYVLDPRSCEHILELPTNSIKISINQGYDARGARFRKEVNSKKRGKKYDEFFSFNYKFQVGDIIEEFEKAISEQEFNRCYPHCVTKIEKERFIIVDENKSEWSIDFFKTEGRVYFAMAECELHNETSVEPETILPFVEKYLIYTVPRDEFYAYSSFKVSDVQYAENQLTLLMN